MILTEVNQSTKIKNCFSATVFTTNPILTGLEPNSAPYSERPFTNCLSYVVYFISTNINLASYAVYKSERIYVLSILIQVLYLYFNYILKMDGSYCEISGGT